MDDAPRKDEETSEHQAPETTTGIYIKPSSFSLQKWTHDVRSAPTIAKAVDALNRSAFTVGLQIPRARVDEAASAKELIKAGIAASVAENIVKRGLRDGIRTEQKRIETRQAAGTAVPEGGQS